MDSPGVSAFGRAAAVLRREFDHFTRLPFAIQMPAAASVILAFGSLMPWATESGFESAADYENGITFNAGELTFLTAVAAFVAIVRLVRRRGLRDFGGLAGLGLLACSLILIEAIKLHDNHLYSLAWGIYLSAAAAVVLLISGLLLVGGPEQPLPPPD
jgi:hypothetical protein